MRQSLIWIIPGRIPRNRANAAECPQGSAVGQLPSRPQLRAGQDPPSGNSYARPPDRGRLIPAARLRWQGGQVNGANSQRHGAARSAGLGQRKNGANRWPSRVPSVGRFPAGEELVIDWSIEAVSFGNCNCDYFCPCQFESAPSGSHDDILLSLAIACWRLKVAGDEPGILSYYRNAVERAKQTDLSVGATEVSRPSRWVGSPKQVAEDAQELYEVYWNTFSGLIQSNVCAS